ncbi:hypothetical protein LINPERPRIM_LOCUS15151 [Linum perenne]
MSSTVAKNQSTRSAEDHEEGDEEIMPSSVSSHVCLKPAHAPGTLDKEMVLRRIRQRKRMNKVTGAIQGLFGFGAAEKPNNVKPDGRSVCVKWVDDAFAAP